MFSGIVEELGVISKATSSSLQICANAVLERVKLGESIAVNGVCLTVTSFTNQKFTVDVAPETIRRTNLGKLRSGDVVNLERSLCVGDRIGGHFVQGHVDNIATVLSVKKEGIAYIVHFVIDESLVKYIVEKGYVAIDGMSLTVISPHQNTFAVSFIPHTLENTVAKNYKHNVIVNLEVDILAKYIENFTTKVTGTKINREFLNKNGFA